MNSIRLLAALGATSVAFLFPSAGKAAESKVAASSNWIKVATPGEQADPLVAPRGIPNETYLSVRLLASVLRPSDGWWTKFIANNDRVGLIANVTAEGSSPQSVLSQFEPVQNRESFQFSTNKNLIRDQPLGRSTVSIQLSMVATSDDGVAKMLNELSTALPTAGIAVSAGTTAAVSLGKSVLDALFGKQLLKTGLKSDYELGALDSGVYVILASEKDTAYNMISGSELSWSNGRVVRGNNQQLPNNVSYMALRVDHLRRRYPTPESVLAETQTDWAPVYRQIRSIIKPIGIFTPTLQKIQEAIDELKKQESELMRLAQKANTLVQVDKSLTQSERDAVAEADGMMVKHFVEKLNQENLKLRERLASLIGTSTTSPAIRSAAQEGIRNVEGLSQRLIATQGMERFEQRMDE